MYMCTIINFRDRYKVQIDWPPGSTRERGQETNGRPKEHGNKRPHSLQIIPEIS